MSVEIQLEDQGQDFLKLRVDADGVISGYSPIFSNDRITLLGIGTLDGKQYWTRDEVLAEKVKQQDGLFVYIKETGKPDPLPWETETFNYRVESVDPTNEEEE